MELSFAIHHWPSLNLCCTIVSSGFLVRFLVVHLQQFSPYGAVKYTFTFSSRFGFKFMHLMHTWCWGSMLCSSSKIYCWCNIKFYFCSSVQGPDSIASQTVKILKHVIGESTWRSARLVKLWQMLCAR